MPSFSPAGASSASALATFRLIESFLRLPTITATSRGLRIPFDVFEIRLRSILEETDGPRPGAGCGYPFEPRASRSNHRRPVPVVNQIRIYWWCSQPRTGRQYQRPDRTNLL